MSRGAFMVSSVLVLGSSWAALSQDTAPAERKKVADGVYAVVRDSLKEKELLPLKDGEVLLVNRHRYLKKGKNEPPRFLVVGANPEVTLDLAERPKAVKEGEEVVRILLKLQPKPAAALERLTRKQLGRQVAIVLGSEVVTMHKVRGVINGGAVQITSCAPGAAKYLLEQLQARKERK
jgi:preprotein translocase subunit SecD